MEDDNKILKVLSDIFGWIYFFAWSFSFYGQIYENYNKQSVIGLSFDYILYNLTGFICYSIFTLWGYLNINLGTGPISIQDVVFAFHGLFAIFFTIYQMFKYYKPENQDQEITPSSKSLTICIWWGFIVCILIERIFNLFDPTEVKGFRFNSVIYLGFSKVFYSLIGYIPQVIYNFKRESTFGWSVNAIILDLIGGFFSLAQNIVDVVRGYKDNENSSLNIAKFSLSFVTIFFDFIFMFQFYWLYPKQKERAVSEDPKFAYLTEEESVNNIKENEVELKHKK